MSKKCRGYIQDFHGDQVKCSCICKLCFNKNVNAYF
jgi:hypothetical protein